MLPSAVKRWRVNLQCALLCLSMGGNIRAMCSTALYMEMKRHLRSAVAMLLASLQILSKPPADGPNPKSPGTARCGGQSPE